MKPSNPAVATQRSFGKQVKSQLPKFAADPLIVCLLLAAITLALYWPALGFEFVNFDDHGYFMKNSRVQNGLSWSGFCWALGTGEMNNWHPLTWLSYMLDVTVFCSDSPEGPHFTNICFHAANSILLFLLLRRLTGCHWRSALVAGLFAWHPLNVESVAWISERKNVLSTFFGLLALIAYSRYVTSDRWQVTRTNSILPPFTLHASRFYFLSLFCFAGSLMAKPMLVTLPFVLLLLDYWPLGRVARIYNLVLEKIPFFLLSVIACAVTFLIQQQTRAMKSIADYPVGGRVENAFVSICRYLGKTFWPDNLTVFYQHPQHWPWTAAVPAAVFVLAVCLIVVWQGRRFPCLFAGWFWFLGTLVPVIGLVQVGRQAMADRYAYVPLIGIFILVSWGAAEVYRRWKLPVFLAVISAAAILTACGWRSRNQLDYWQNDLRLFGHAVGQNPDYAWGHLSLGYYFAGHNRPADAEDHFRTAIRLEPDNLIGHVNLGILMDSGGRSEEAVKEFREAARISPQSPEVHYNLACALVRFGRRDEAFGQFKAALHLDPDFLPAAQGLKTLKSLPLPGQSIDSQATNGTKNGAIRDRPGADR